MSKHLDLLDMQYINGLPHPLLGEEWGGSIWPIYDIDVACGLVRIDVCGKLEVKDIGDFKYFYDDAGEKYRADGFYIDSIEEERLPLTTEANGE